MANYNLREFKIISIVVLFLAACTPFYVISDFENRTDDHQEVAVLPFEMIFTGVAPANLTEEDIVQIELAESQAFQISFTNEILRSTRSGKKPIRVSIQDHVKTNRLLENSGIDLRSTWTMSTEDLAEILEVDAVVRGRIQKNRLMTDLESYGIDVAVHILTAIHEFAWPWIPGGLATSKQIHAKYTLLDGASGDVLWSVALDQDADWSLKSNEIIDEMNRRSAKKFPYREG